MIAESIFFIVGSLLLSGKLASILMGVGMSMYACYQFVQFLQRIKLLKEYVHVS